MMKKVLLAITNLLFLASALTACGGGGGGGGASTPAVNTAPTAVITVAKTTGYAPLTVEFDGGSSSDPDGSISSYTWHTGDGNSYAGSAITHTYEGLGTFAATLTVTDDDGASHQRSVNIEVYARTAGLYQGDFSLTSSVTGISYYTDCLIGSNHQAFCWLWNHDTGEWSARLAGSINVLEDIIRGTLLAEAEPGYIFPDGSDLGEFDIEGTVIPKEQLTNGTFSGAGDTGTFGNIFFDNNLDFPVTISNIAGTWSWSDGLGYEEVMTVDSTGAFSFSSSDGCTISGLFSLMDPAINEFEMAYNLDTSVCDSGAGDGERIGVAFLDNYYDPEDWLVWRVVYQEGPHAGEMTGSALLRPRASGSVSSGMQKPSQAVPKRPPKGMM